MKEKNVVKPISCSITWVDGRNIFVERDNKPFSKFYYGICNYSKGIWAITPLDYEKPTVGLTTIVVSEEQKYCDKAGICMNLSCDFNRFHIDEFLKEFKGMGAFSLSLPRDFGKNKDKEHKYNWFNYGKWKNFWGHFIIPNTGGVIKFDKERYEKVAGRIIT